MASLVRTMVSLARAVPESFPSNSLPLPPQFISLSGIHPVNHYGIIEKCQTNNLHPDLDVFSHKIDSIFGRISEFLFEKKYFRYHNEIFIHEKI